MRCAQWEGCLVMYLIAISEGEIVVVLVDSLGLCLRAGQMFALRGWWAFCVPVGSAT